MNGLGRLLLLCGELLKLFGILRDHEIYLLLEGQDLVFNLVLPATRLLQLLAEHLLRLLDVSVDLVFVKAFDAIDERSEFLHYLFCLSNSLFDAEEALVELWADLARRNELPDELLELLQLLFHKRLDMLL